MEKKQMDRDYETTRDLYTKKLVTNQQTGRRNQVLQCKICQTVSNKTFEMENHIRKHSKSRPFICEKCGFSFTTMGNKLRHLAHDSCHKFKRRQN